MAEIQNFFHISDLEHQRKAGGKRYHEFLRVPAMSAGVYALAAESSDPQKPHGEDELYYVVRGQARMQIAEQEQSVGPGSVVFVAARVEHRFFDITEELVVLVFFAPEESS